MLLRLAATAEDLTLLDRALEVLELRTGYGGYREALEAGSLSCYVLTAASERRGVVLAGVSQVGRAGPELWVSGAWAEPGVTAAERRVAGRLVRRLARALGCRHVTFAATRKGWSRAARRFGFTASAQVFSQEA